MPTEPITEPRTEFGQDERGWFSPEAVASLVEEGFAAGRAAALGGDSELRTALDRLSQMVDGPQFYGRGEAWSDGAHWAIRNVRSALATDSRPDSIGAFYGAGGGTSQVSAHPTEAEAACEDCGHPPAHHLDSAGCACGCMERFAHPAEAEESPRE